MVRRHGTGVPLGVVVLGACGMSIQSRQTRSRSEMKSKNERKTASGAAFVAVAAAASASCLVFVFVFVFVYVGADEAEGKNGLVGECNPGNLVNKVNRIVVD